MCFRLSFIFYLIIIFIRCCGRFCTFANHIYTQVSGSATAIRPPTPAPAIASSRSFLWSTPPFRLPLSSIRRGSWFHLPQSCAVFAAQLCFCARCFCLMLQCFHRVAVTNLQCKWYARIRFGIKGWEKQKL